MFWNRNRQYAPIATLSGNDELFDRFFEGMFRNDSAVAFPAFNVWAHADGAVIAGELPGVRLEDVEITASGKTVRIAGSRKEKQGEDAGRSKRERYAGDFSRVVELPFRIDAEKVVAKLVNGILEISLPRAESDKPRKIAVNVG